MSISGISSDPSSSLVATHVGDYGGFKDIYACPEATANILSFSKVKQYSAISYNEQTDVFDCRPRSGPSYRFIPKDGHYVYSLVSSAHSSAMVTTVKENLKLFSQREIAEADKAKSLSRALGYPGPATLIDMLNSGAIINSPVTAMDVARAKTIYGPELQAIRGKTKKQRVTSSPIEYISRELASDQVLHVDIMYVCGTAYLLSVSTPLGLTLVTELGHTKGSRSLSRVRDALFAHIDTYSSRRFSVQALKTDSEGSIIAMTTELNARHIEVNPVGAGAHVPIV